MADYSVNQHRRAVVKGASYFLAHVPSLVRVGSKPSREIMYDPQVLAKILEHMRSYDSAVAYPPNQVYIGNLDPDDLLSIARPWYQNLIPNASRWGSFGEIMPEDEFYGMVKICDEFELFLLETSYLQKVKLRLQSHPLINSEDINKLGKGVSLEQIKDRIRNEQAIPIHTEGEQIVGCMRRGYEEDSSLVPEVLLENLSSRAAGVMALRNLIANTGNSKEIEYILGCGEEAVGDRYNRGGGSLSKAIGELCGCAKATGSDIKAFCCAPVHAIILAAGLIASNLFHDVALVAGGSLSKLGMKFQGHVRNDMPILEDVLAGIAIWVSQDDGKSPVIRLDSVGKHEISSGSSQQAILEKLVVEPLDKIELKITQIDKYATEMHNPEITEPQGSGNVPRTNYRTIGSFAVMRNEIKKEELDKFVETYGMLGFSPTQGHIASAVPYLGHALRNMKSGRINNCMFLAKGSLFLGRMTHLSDGISFLLQKQGV